MDEKEFFDQIQEKGEVLNIFFSVEQKLQFYKYMQLLLEWNNKINLTAITIPEEIILKHFIDSLTIYKKLIRGAKIIDVGTGAGFPGIPLAIIDENLKITLNDSLNKRLIFLTEVKKQLKLDNIEIIHARAEEIGQNKKYREKFDYATSRAVANLSTLSEYLLPLVKINGKCICMKASNIEEELNQAQNAIKLLGGEVTEIEKFKLPQSDIDRTIITISKNRNTPNKYPRKAGTPSKDPIK